MNGTNSLLGFTSKSKSKDVDTKEDPNGVVEEEAVDTDLLEVWFSGCHGGEWMLDANRRRSPDCRVLTFIRDQMSEAQ